MTLNIGKPLVGALGFGAHACEIEGHSRFDVIPRIGVSAWVPQDHSIGLLPIGNCFSGLTNLLGSDDVVNGRNLDHFAPAIAACRIGLVA